MINIFNFKIVIFLGVNKFTNKKLLQIKNLTFKNNVFDLSSGMIVKTIYLKSINNSKRALIWTYFRDRKHTNVNDIINKYKKSNIIINYSFLPLQNINKN
jgi:hypothetical protein